MWKRRDVTKRRLTHLLFLTNFYAQYIIKVKWNLEKKMNFYAKCSKNLLFIENVTIWPFNLVNTNMVSDLVKIFFFNFKSILTIALSKYKNHYSKIWLFAKCFVLFWCRCMMVSSFSLSPFWVHIYYQHNWLWIIIDIYSTP